MAGSDQETRGGFGGQLSAASVFPDSLLTDFREAYAKHGDALCWIWATPDNQEAPEPCIGLVKLPPVADFKQSSFWLSIGWLDLNADDGDTAARDFLPLAKRAGAYLPAEYRRGLSQARLLEPAGVGLLEPAEAWCLALLRLAIERGRFDDVALTMMGDGCGGWVALEWHRPYAASVELLETLQGHASGGSVDAKQPQAVRGAGAAGELQDAAHGGDGMTWQDVQGELETLRLKGERYTSQQRLADRIGCKKFLVQKAIANGPAELQEWASKQRGASRLNAAPEAAAVAFQNTPQARELDPANIIEDGDIDAAMAYLLDQAGPDERARINAMSPAERRKLAETVYQDPDQEEQALRHRRAAKTRRN